MNEVWEVYGGLTVLVVTIGTVLMVLLVNLAAVL